MQYDKFNDYAGFTLDEQIRAEDEAYDSGDTFCGCDQCESQWAEYDYTDF